MEQMWMSSLKRQVKMPSRIPSWHRFRKDSSGRVICHNSSPLHVPNALCLSLCGNFHRHRMDFLDPWLWAGLICFDQQGVSRREAEAYNLSVWMNLPSCALSWLREECAPAGRGAREDKGTWRRSESSVYLGAQPPCPEFMPELFEHKLSLHLPPPRYTGEEFGGVWSHSTIRPTADKQNENYRKQLK